MQFRIGSSSLIWLLLRISIFIVDLNSQITPKGESTNMTRTEWLTSRRLIFSLSINKTAKKRDIVRDSALAHSLPKEGDGSSSVEKEVVNRNEKGVSKYFRFIGFDVHGDSGRSTNALPAKLQRHALWTTLRPISHL